MRPGAPVAAIVGCVLSLINEGATIASGPVGVLTWIRVGLNFVVPFLVASYGYLAASRVPRGSRTAAHLAARRPSNRRKSG